MPPLPSPPPSSSMPPPLLAPLPSASRAPPLSPSPGPPSLPYLVFPPIPPLDDGATATPTLATVVAISLTIAGDLSTFDAALQADLSASLRRSLICEEPRCHLALSATAASVSVVAMLTIPDASRSNADGAGQPGEPAAGAAAAVAAAARALAAQPTSTISSTLGVAVEAMEVPRIARAIVPIVVAPPPPVPIVVVPPPPALLPSATDLQSATLRSPPTPVQSPTPASPSPSGLLVGTPVSPQTADDGSQSAPSSTLGVIMAVVCGVLLLLGVACLVFCRMSRRRGGGLAKAADHGHGDGAAVYVVPPGSERTRKDMHAASTTTAPEVHDVQVEEQI